MIISYLFSFIPIVAILAIMPYVVRRDNFFGVSAPYDFYENTTAKKMRIKYSVLILIIGSIFSLSAFFANTIIGEKSQPTAMIVSLVALLLVSSVIYIIMNKIAKKLKKELEWETQAEPAVITDTKFFTSKIAVSKLWFLLYGAIIFLTIGLGLYYYPNMAAQVPIHTGINGVITYAEKSFKLVFYMPLTQLMVTAAFALVYYSIKKTRPELSVNSVKKTVEQNIKHRFYWSAFSVFSGLAIVALFLFVQLEMLGLIEEISVIASLVSAGLVLIVAIILAVITGQSGSRIKTKSEGGQEKTINRDDDRHWKMGMFYFNKEDPSLFVEKRFGIGFTFNFGRPLGWILLGVIVIVIIGGIILR